MLKKAKPWILTVIAIALAAWAVLTSSSFKQCIYGSENQGGGESIQEYLARINEFVWIYKACIGKFLHSNDQSVIALFTIVLAVSTIFLWTSTRNAAIAARMAADHIPNVERGYIVGGGPTPVDNGLACIDIVNYRKTAAILTKIEWGFCEEKDFPVDAPVSELLKTGRLKVDEYRITEDVLPPNRPPVYFQNTKFPISKALGKIFYGKFTYSIIFDSDEHFSTFKLRVPQIFPNAPSVGLPGSYSDWK